MAPLQADLEQRGFDVVNLSYRRVGEAGGGWPGTFDDVCAGVLACGADVVVGHSAGGQLALWAASVVPGVRLAVSLAGVVDLIGGAGLSNGAAASLLGGTPAEVPERYAAASPLALLPLGVRTVLVHGAEDDTVPVEMSEAYAAAAVQAGDEVELVVVAGEGHFEPIDPASASWAAVVARL
jgi:dipeptidyl aminopeptidase/acylaminoacyl peptidase